jgi:hypothetical protein
VPGSITISSFGVVKIDRSLIERDRVADVRDMPDAPAAILPGVPQALPGGAL